MTGKQFKRWLKQRLADVELTISRCATEHCAQIVFEAKAHAYRLRLYDLARRLPERDVVTPLDCCLRLRDCLVHIESPPSACRNSDASIGLAEAAKRLGYQPEGLRRLVKQKRIKYVQHGQGRIKFRREWLDEYINANTSGPDDIKRSPVQRRRPPISFKLRDAFDPSLFRDQNV
jgi:excisionase family DNA binding protein